MRYDSLQLTKVGPGRRAVLPGQLGRADVGRASKNVAKMALGELAAGELGAVISQRLNGSGHFVSCLTGLTIGVTAVDIFIYV